MEKKGEAAMQYCSVPNCYRIPKSLGYCSMHYSRLRSTGSIERTRQVNQGQLCRHDECKKPARKLGYCLSHYRYQHRHGHLRPRKLKREHPHYSLWFERKTRGALAPEWLDFWKFVEDIGQKPGENFFLVRKVEGPYGPSNFEWMEKLKKLPNETNKEWNARQWRSRRKRFPLYEDNRYLKRKYGISRSTYDEMLKAQNNVCAICKTVETVADARTGGFRKLSVDHCHRTGKVRSLLCNRCNTAIGLIEESPVLMHSFLEYLEKHKNEF